MTAPSTITLWVCIDCVLAYHHGGDYTPFEGATPWALFDLTDGAPTITSQVTAGLMYGEDGCPHTGVEPQDPQVDAHAEDCERKAFTWSRCDGCGSTLAGERHAMTQWINEEDS